MTKGELRSMIREMLHEELTKVTEAQKRSEYKYEIEYATAMMDHQYFSTWAKSEDVAIEKLKSAIDAEDSLKKLISIKKFL